MKKETIQRDDLKDNIMKQIIFRFDYQGMIDSTDFVKSFNNSFAGKFKSYSKNTHNKVELQLSDLEDISNTLSIPVSEVIKQDIHVYRENQFGSDEVTLNIGVYNTIMNVVCKNYKNIDAYLDFIGEYAEFLFTNESYLELKRFGLRKIGSKIYEDFDSIHIDFEREYFPFKKIYFSEFELFRNRIEETLFIPKNKLKINFIRALDTGMVRNHQTGVSTKAYQALLDLDAYLDEEALISSEYKGNFRQLLTTINNKILFDLFKNSMTEKFLNQNSIIKP